MLLKILKMKAIEMGLVNPKNEIDVEKAFLLVRDIPYARASSREPETIIREWRGTCSGKHYLLKGLFAELGYPSRLIACTTVIKIDPKQAWEKLRRLLKQSNGYFVDVHNYLILELSEGEMIVDATWPISAKSIGWIVVNEHFVLGENQKIAAQPLKSWDIPNNYDFQKYKNIILKNNFTQEELYYRDEYIKLLSEMTNKLI